jgi:importin-4
MLKVVQQTVVSDNSEGVKHGFDVFETLLLLDTPLLSKHVPEYTDLCLSVGGNQDVDSEIRCAALNSLSWTIQ